MCKRGDGKLRPINGTLLWYLEIFFSKEFGIKQIGIIRKNSTKPFNHQNLKFLLRKCNAFDGEGNRVKEREM